MEDFPSSNGVSFYEIIKSAIEDEGYRGEVSIMAYGEKKREEYNLDDGVVTLEPKSDFPFLKTLFIIYVGAIFVLVDMIYTFRGVSMGD